MKSEKIGKLVLVGSSANVHLKNYFHLISSLFEEILLITNEKPNYEVAYEIVNFGIKNPLTLKKTIKSVRNIVEQFSPDIVHVHQANSVGYIVSKAIRKEVPCVLTLWGSDILILPEKNAFYKKIVKTSLGRANIITGDAGFMLEKAKDLGYKGKTVNANFGINLATVDSSISKKNIVYSNRLHNPLYNIDKIIDGFALFVENNQDWKLRIAGSGSETENLKSLASKILPEDSFEFVGFISQEENNKNYTEAKIWLSIPSSDGTAMSLLESMAFGCLPVVSNLPANREWVSNGNNGIVVENTIEKSLVQASKMDVESVSIKNSQIIESRATKKVNFEIFKEVYLELLNIHESKN